jgi:hypothetical protein
MFQVKLCQEEPVHREVLQKSKKPPPSNKKGTDAKIKSFWLKARGLRVGRNQIYIRLGVQPKFPPAAPSPVGAPNSPPKTVPVCWGPWNTSPLCVLVSLDLSAREESKEKESNDAFQNSHAAAAPAAGDWNGACPTKRKASEISSPHGAGASDGVPTRPASSSQSQSAGCTSPGVKAGKGKTPAKAPGGGGGARAGPSSATRTTRATAAAAAATSQVTGSAGGAEKASATAGGGGGGQGQGRGESGDTPARRTRSQVQGMPAAP